MDLGQGGTGKRARGSCLLGALLVYCCWAVMPPLPGDDGLAVAGWRPPPGGWRSTAAQAEDENGFPPGPPVEEYGPEDIDEAHREISERLLGTADWLDSFFVDERIEEEETRARLRLSLSALVREGEDVDVDPRIDLRLTLPNTRDRLRLLVFGDPDDGAGAAGARRGVGRDAPFERRTSDRLTTALQYFITATDERNISARAGLRFRSLSPVFFVGPRYRETIELDSWTLRLTQSARWFSDDGWDVPTVIDFERELFDDRFFFRATPYGTWFEDEDGYFYGLNFNLFQPFSPRRAVEYEWNNAFQTRPSNRLEETLVRVRYRQVVWRDWLVVEVAPELSFPRDRDFEPTPGILLGFDVIFGNFPWEGFGDG
jgi:hypothetical protein